MSIYEFDEEREMKLIREDEREIGREEGLSAAKSDAICKLLSAKGDVSEALRTAILEEKCLDVLDAWFTLAIEVNTVWEFEEKYHAKVTSVSSHFPLTDCNTDTIPV